MSDPNLVVERVARAIADIDLKARMGHVWTDEQWNRGVAYWRSKDVEDLHLVSGIDLPMRMAEAAIKAMDYDISGGLQGWLGGTPHG